MRLTLFICFFALLSSASAVTLITENFDAPPSFPTGWTKTGPSTSNWSVVSGNEAGGTSGELKFNFTPSTNGTYRFISPAIDTRKVYDMGMSFRHFLSDYNGSSGSYTLAVQVSNNLNTWTNVWSQNVSANIPATEVSFEIPFNNGMSQTTYFAFTFIGNPFDINRWIIDNVNLGYSNTLGSGTWAAGEYFPPGNIIVPSGHTFTISGGSTLHFAEQAKLWVNGSLRVMGSFGLPVTLTSLSSGMSWAGLRVVDTGNGQDSTLISYMQFEKSDDSCIITNSNKVRISNSVFTDNDCYSLWAVLALFYTNAIVENCHFIDHSSAAGPILYAYSGSPVIRNNRFDNNIIMNSTGAIRLEEYNLSLFTGNSMTRNYTLDSNRMVLYVRNCSGTLYRQMIANNVATGIQVEGSSNPTIRNCMIVNNYFSGVYSVGPVTIDSSIIWGNRTGSVYNGSNATTIRYSCIAGGSSGVGGTAIPGANYTNNTSSNPMFINPTTTNDSTTDPSIADWRLQIGSPCIDSGNPSSPLDEDGSIVDMGMYSRKLKPLIIRANDVPNDQGHQLDLVWQSNELDTTYQPGAFYSVWRESSSRSNATLIANPAQLAAALSQNSSQICWVDGDRSWYYLAQVPAVTFPDYGLIAPTLQDSSSTGTHAANYRVIYHNTQGYFPSVSKSGYSVDNIPPATAGNIILRPYSNNSLRLSWDEVTEGLWQGNSYPEVNQIRYKVYASDTPDFTPSPATYQGITSDPQITVIPSAPRQFYRIIATDSE